MFIFCGMKSFLVFLWYKSYAKRLLLVFMKLLVLNLFLDGFSRFFDGSVLLGPKRDMVYVPSNSVYPSYPFFNFLLFLINLNGSLDFLLNSSP